MKTVGSWRERMLSAMAKGYLTSNLGATRYFRSLEQSEKAGVSFLFGEAFTHWYAQRYMNIEYLVHVAGVKGCTWVTPKKKLAPKAGAATPSPVNAGEILQRLAGVKVQHGRKQEGPRSGAFLLVASHS